MAGFAHNWLCAVGDEVVDDYLGGFDIKNNFGSREALEHIAGEEEEHVIGRIVVALFVNDSYAVAVAIEADAEIGVVGFDGGN